LNNGLDHIRTIIGPESENGLSDSDIKDALWNFFFDNDKTVEWLLGTLDFAANLRSGIDRECRGTTEKKCRERAQR